MNKPIHAFLPQLPTRGSFVQIDRLRIVPNLLAKVYWLSQHLQYSTPTLFRDCAPVVTAILFSKSSALFAPPRTGNQALFLFVRAGRIRRLRRHSLAHEFREIRFRKA
jgi:hypothetical protein